MPSLTPLSIRNAPGRDAWPAPSMFSSLYDGFDHMLDNLNRAWASIPGNGLGNADALVRMDCAETKDGIELTAEMPGLKEKDVQVVLSGRILTISGEKRSEREQKDEGYSLVERAFGSFSRSVELPDDIDAAKIKATLSDGLLKVTAPRKAKAEAQQIEIQSNA